MEDNKNTFPVVLKKKNTMMIAAIIMELIVAGNFWFIDGAKVGSAIFIFVAVITAISLWDESCEKISLSEHKFEVSKRTDLLKSINYEKISTLTIEKGDSKKNKKKNYLSITFFEHSKKKKKSEGSKEKYLVDLSCYSLKDLKKIKEVITGQNPNVRVTKEFEDYINRK